MAEPAGTYRRKGIRVMDDTQKKQSLQSINVILRILAIVYVLLQFLLLRIGRIVCLPTTIPIMIIAVRNRKDTTNLRISIIASAGIVFYFITSYFLPRSFLHENNGDLTFLDQMSTVIWALCLFTGTYLLALRDLVIASKENDEKGKAARIIGYILLLLSAIPIIQILGFLVWMTVTNYYP